MRRWLAIVVILFAQASVPVPRQTANDTTLNTDTVTKHGKANKKKTAPAPVEHSVSPASTRQKGQNEAPENKQVHVVVDRAPGKDAWDKVYICLTGVLVLVATLTFGAIWYQARETARASKAAADTVAAIKQQTDLQKAAMQQWLVFTNWTTNYHVSAEGTAVVDVRFEIINPTRSPLTLLTTKMHTKRKESWTRHNITLAPNVPCAVTLQDIPLDNEERNGYLNNAKVVFRIFGRASYRDCFEEIREQNFSGLLRFGKTSGADFALEWFPDNPLDIKPSTET